MNTIQDIINSFPAEAFGRDYTIKNLITGQLFNKTTFQFHENSFMEYYDLDVSNQTTKLQQIVDGILELKTVYIPSNAVPIEIDGIEFPSIAVAAKAISLLIDKQRSDQSIKKLIELRLNSKMWPNWKYIKKSNFDDSVNIDSLPNINQGVLDNQTKIAYRHLKLAMNILAPRELATGLDKYEWAVKQIEEGHWSYITLILSNRDPGIKRPKTGRVLIYQGERFASVESAVFSLAEKLNLPVNRIRRMLSELDEDDMKESYFISVNSKAKCSKSKVEVANDAEDYDD